MTEDSPDVAVAEPKATPRRRKQQRVYAPPKNVRHLMQPKVGDVVMWHKPGALTPVPSIVNRIGGHHAGAKLLSLTGFSADSVLPIYEDAHAVPHEDDIQNRNKLKRGYWTWTERELHLRKMIDILVERLEALEAA